VVVRRPAVAVQDLEIDQGGCGRVESSRPTCYEAVGAERCRSHCALAASGRAASAVTAPPVDAPRICCALAPPVTRARAANHFRSRHPRPSVRRITRLCDRVQCAHEVRPSGVAWAPRPWTS
jgi:hypothetical protein